MFSENVRCLVVVGAQWGDEGKGKLVDVLSEQATIVARYQGGANAGHTVRVEDDEFILHLIPSGILYEKTRCLLGNGVVVDPWTLADEMQRLRERGIDLDGRLGLSRRAHLVLPYHRALDQAHEGSREDDKKIGTTGRGIGPAYRDKIARVGVRVGDLADMRRARDLVEAGCSAANSTLERLEADPVAPGDVMDALDTVRDGLLELSTDSGHEIRNGLAGGGRILLEGAQGALLDIDHGTYPYVTSSTTTAGGAAAGVGIGPTLIDEVLGVVKAYTTRVGNGPLPTELDGDEAERLRQLGGEFGATTGRPRRPGWFDSNVVRYAAGVNGLTALAVTKLDVLDTFEEILLATDYELDGEVVGPFPDSVDDLDRVTPIYARHQGWKTGTTDCRSWEELPTEARQYLRRLEGESTVPIRYVSIGAARRETIRVPAGGVSALS